MIRNKKRVNTVCYRVEAGWGGILGRNLEHGWWKVHMGEKIGVKILTKTQPSATL